MATGMMYLSSILVMRLSFLIVAGKATNALQPMYPLATIVVVKCEAN
jgi:hypothetical protein